MASSTMASTSLESPIDSPKPSSLSPTDFKAYNRMADHMDLFHTHFRSSWTTIYEACEKGRRPAGMSIPQFLYTGLQFCNQLDMHHRIEEQHIFPVLARKMPAFRKELELLTQHKQIHAGLDKLQAYLESCSHGERDLRLSELKELLDTFGEVLWSHLADEVEQLGAKNMRKYWTIDEMKKMPM